MEHQKLASLKDDEDGSKLSKPRNEGTTKGGAQKLKFTPTVPSARRPKTEQANYASTSKPATTRTRQPPRPKPSGGLMGSISEQPATGTFAHGFGIFGKAKTGSAATGSIAGISKFNNANQTNSSLGADEYRGGESVAIENAIDTNDPLSPVTVHSSKGPLVTNGVPVNTPVFIQIPGLHDLVDYGNDRGVRSHKSSSLLGQTDTEKIIDMEAFKKIKDEDKGSEVASWPADRVDRIGELHVHKSGKVSITIGSYSFDVQPVNYASSASLWAIDREYGHIFDIASVEDHFVASMKFTE